MEEERYVDFITNQFSMADLLLALDTSNIKDFAIIKEENDLHVRIPVSHLKKIVYHTTDMDTSVCAKI